jgi:RHS repeat-associated protein
MSKTYSKYILLVLIIMAAVASVQAQSVPGSNIVSRTVLSSDGVKAVEQRVYDNGLGDIVQEAVSYTGSTLPDIVVHHEYDEYRRRTRTWLPVTSPSGSGFICGSMVGYTAQSQYSDTAPFSRTEYDGFLVSQPSAQYKAGAQWQTNGKKVSSTYSEYVGVGMFMYLNEGVYIYTMPGVKYLCTRAVDEDGCWTAEYTDLNGRLMVSETSQGKTYYIYDEKGDIAYVIPPALSDYIVSYYGEESEDISDTDEMMQKYAYIYHYDNQRHCICKKLPGCAPIYYVYDRAGNCILTQDGEQRQRQEWTYTIPDRFGRPCISGICHNSMSYAAEPMHAYHVYAEYDGASAATGGYAVHNITLDSQTLYSAAYYDNYSFIGQHGVPASLTASPVSGYAIDTSLGRGLQTGSATAVIGGGAVKGYTYTAMYYDSRYNVSQVKATNHLGSTDVTCTSYSYTGKPLGVRIQHPVGNTGFFVESLSYTYDDADRMSSCTLAVEHGAPAVSSALSYEYDDLGRLAKVTRPITSNSNPNPDVTYTYDMHGWTTGITTGSFCEELFYADGPGTPQYNGNISSMRWKDRKSTQKRGYKFSYDNANRLTQGLYGEGDDITANANRFSESMEYDSQGNVTRIIRHGKTSSSGYGVMDNLTLTYDGNLLTGVSETAPDYDVAGSFEYKRANGSEYIYNSNGSLVADRSRGIAYITYDVNNNPQAIYFTNGSVTKYAYSATGEKLRSIHHTAMPYITRTFGVKPPELEWWETISSDSIDYLFGGNLTLKNGRIDKCLFDGGYAWAISTGTATDRFVFYYYNKDHLGNNRELVTATGITHQVTNYYPFGAPYADPAAVSSADRQPYKYNGKELDKMHGLNTYDYGARQYNPITARWDRPDPLAEKYYPYSPYVYCLNNPIRLIDPDGRDIYPVIFRNKDNQGNACGESYLSYVKCVNAMTSLGKTSYGREFIGSFLQKGQSQYGVKGSGKNADCILSIYQFGFDNPEDNFMYMGKNNASFSISEKEGKLNIILQIDCSSQNQGEITESLLHEFTLHGYLVNDIIDAYRAGGFDAAKKIYNSVSESSDHNDLKAHPHVRGGRLYNETAKELIQKQPNLQDIIEKKRKNYE